jgi:hypothetical protein
MKQLHLRNGWLYYNGNNGAEVRVDPRRLKFELGEHVYYNNQNRRIPVRPPTVEDAPLHPVVRGFSGGAPGNFSSHVVLERTSPLGKLSRNKPQLINVLKNDGLSPAQRNAIETAMVKELLNSPTLNKLANVIENNNRGLIKLKHIHRKQLTEKLEQLLAKLNM